MENRKLSSSSSTSSVGVSMSLESIEGIPNMSWSGWRNLPIVDNDLMIISSYGEEHPLDVTVARKLAPPGRNADRIKLARQELDCIMDLYKKDATRHVVYCYSDHGAAQYSKDYYLQRMRKLLLESKKELGTTMTIQYYNLKPFCLFHMYCIILYI